jgi:hypothetical protein
MREGEGEGEGRGAARPHLVPKQRSGAELEPSTTSLTTRADNMRIASDAARCVGAAKRKTMRRSPVSSVVAGDRDTEAMARANLAQHWPQWRGRRRRQQRGGRDDVGIWMVVVVGQSRTRKGGPQM